MDYSLILNNVSKHISLNNEEKEYFFSKLELVRVKRNAFLVRKGEECPNSSIFSASFIKCLMEYFGRYDF